MPPRITGIPPWTSRAKNVATTATSMPAAAMRFPWTAVVGDDSPLSPRTNVTAAMR